jgi:hypothetical protein
MCQVKLPSHRAWLSFRWIVFALFLTAIPGAVAQQRSGLLTSRPRAKEPAVTALEVGAAVQTEAGQRRRLRLPDGSTLFVNENTRAELETAGKLALAQGEVYVELTPRNAKQTGPFVVQTPFRSVTGKGAGFAVRVQPQGASVFVARGTVQVSGLAKPLAAGQQLPAAAKTPQTAPRPAHVLHWTRELMAAAAPGLVPDSQYAGGALVAVDPDGQEMKLSLRKYHIDVHIEDGFARTTIDQTYFNHENTDLEGTFYFPLPPDASLARLAMYVDGNLMEGGMVVREYGADVYESIRYMRRDPALLEWVDGSTFKMRVFPLEARKEKRIILSYTQKLPALHGQRTYRFPAGHSLPVVQDWSVNVRLKGGANLTWASPSHVLQARKTDGDLLLTARKKNALFDKDVVVEIIDPALADNSARKVRFATALQDGSRYLLVQLRPDLLRPVDQEGVQNSGPRRWLFLYESSGDRDPLLARVQIEVIRHLLAHAGPQDTFDVLTAATRVKRWAPEPQPVTPENIDQAIAFLENSHLIGALDLGQAFTAAGETLGKGNDAFVVHVGSGIPAMGERRLDVLAQSFPAGTRYIGVGVGRRWSRALMKTAAEQTGGYFTQINPDEPVAWRSFELFSTVQTLGPDHLRRVTIEGLAPAEEGKESPRFLYFNQLLTAGEELGAVARLDGNAALPKELRLRFGDGRAVTVPVREVKEDADYLPRTWAKLEIDRLLPENAAKHRDRIIELSKAMYVMTPFTSLLVLENDDMYTQYKVDRNRKDHWAMYPAPKKIKVIYEPDPDSPQANKGAKTVTEVLKTFAVREQPHLLKGSSVAAANPEAAEPNKVNGGFGYWRLNNRGPGSPGIPAFYGDMDSDGKLDGFALSGRSAAISDPLGRPALVVLSKAPARIHYKAVGSALGRPPQKRSEGRVQFAPVIAGIPGANADALPELGMLVIREQAVMGTDFAPPESKEVLLRRGELVEAAGAIHVESLTKLAPAERMLGVTQVPRPAGGLADLQKAIDSPDGGGEASASPLYHRPDYSNDEAVFANLLAYAPGMHTSWADVLAVVDAEAIHRRPLRPGTIDPAARALIDKARQVGWQQWTIAADKGQPALRILFDGQGRFAYECVLPPGLREQVVCDGQTLLHLYPQLGLGARRTVSRFHRQELAGMIPWLLPRVEDLARGADLKMIDKSTVAIVPHITAKKAAKDKEPTTYQLRLVFEDGRLIERQLVQLPKDKILIRQVCQAGGVVWLLDEKGKELDAVRGQLAPAEAPSLTPSTKDLVVLALPYRTREYLIQKRKLEKVANRDLRFADAIDLVAADVAAGQGARAQQVFTEALYNRNQRQLGLYVLLSSAGQNLDARSLDVVEEHPDAPLAQYLALHSSPVLRKQASQWAVNAVQWQDPLLKHLAVTHALYQRWQSKQPQKWDKARLQAEREKALDYVRKHKGSAFGWVLLCLLQDQAGKDREFYRELAETFQLFADRPGLGYAARYEQARCLWQAGLRQEAREQFTRLYADSLGKGYLPAIDGDFRLALLGDGKLNDTWGELLRKTAEDFIAKKRRPAVLALAWQCRQIDDGPAADQLITLALDKIGDQKERAGMTLAAVLFYRQISQLPQADRLLQTLLKDAEQAKRPELWRLASTIAAGRLQNVTAIRHLEQALALEFQNLPEVINLKQVRADYAKVLGHYEKLAEAMVALKIEPSPIFFAKVVRTADRWRSLDPQGDSACNSAAGILRTLGKQEMAWDYLTTPVGMKPNESGPWFKLAGEMRQGGDLDLADKAFKAAYESEPTNAQILWDRAQNLRQAGKTGPARELLRRIATGQWQPRFQGLVGQAKMQLQGS